jgi:predicted RNase H-like HicB family nuclease
MLTEYIDAAMRHAIYEILPDDNSYYGEIPACNGVWANELTLEETRKDLRSTLEDWILLHTHDGAEIPVIDGIDINLHELV